MGDAGTDRSVATEDAAAELAALREQVARLEGELSSLRASEGTLRRDCGIFESIIDTMAEGVAYVDMAGNFKLINENAKRMLPAYFDRHRPHSLADVPGIYRSDGVTPCELHELPLARALHGERLADVEICVRADSADPGVWLGTSARPLYDMQGQQCGAVAVFRDITAARRTRHDLQMMHDRFETLVDNTPACIYMKDVDGKYLLINRTYENLFHITRAEMMGRTDYDLFPAELADAFRKNDLHVLQTRQAVQVDEIAPHDDGPHEYISVKFPLLDVHGVPYAVCGISTDITHRRRSEEALRVNQRFLTQVLRAHERERQLLVYELHDGLAQDLAAAVLHLENMTTNRDSLSTRDRASFNIALELAHKSVREVRRLMSGLRPLVLDESGLVQAIAYLIAEQEADGGIEIEFDSDVRFERLSGLVEGSLFRIVQESFTNIRRHSHALRARVALKQQGDELTLTIRDWGIGFDLHQARSGGLGLDSIRKRAETMGGTAKIHSTPEAGTTIEVVVPLDDADG